MGEKAPLCRCHRRPIHPPASTRPATHTLRLPLPPRRCRCPCRPHAVAAHAVQPLVRPMLSSCWCGPCCSAATAHPPEGGSCKVGKSR